MKKIWLTEGGKCRKTRRFKRTCDNLEHNAEVFAENKSRLLNGQQTEPICRMRYGTYPLSHNGCELIACYNAAVMLGKDITFPQVVYEFELNKMHYLFTNGYWGTAPKKLWYFFDEHGMRYTSCRRGDVFAAAAKTELPSCGIISFWNNKRSEARLGGLDFFSGGLHTVAYRYKGGRFFVYNLFGRDLGSRKMEDIADAYREKRFIIGYIFKDEVKY